RRWSSALRRPQIAARLLPCLRSSARLRRHTCSGEKGAAMSGSSRGLDSDRMQRLIDWGVFAAGALSLSLALALTVAALIAPAPAQAGEPTLPLLPQSRAI